MSEIRYERTQHGKLAAWIFTASDRNLLRRCSECLVSELGAQPTERFDAMEQVFLDFLLGGVHIVLEWSQSFGVAVVAGELSTASEALTRRVAAHLAQRVTV